MSNNNSWIDNAINEQHIQLFDYNDFGNVDIFAEGGLAQIKYAEWTRSGRKVVLKKLKTYEVQKFIQEVKMHMSCHWSENVVRFFGLTKDSNLNEYLMIMEYAESKNLRDFLKSGENINWSIKYSLSIDIAKGLNCLHSRNIAHRDLHTKNVVIRRTNNCCQSKFIAQITDFGLAVSMNESVVDINEGLGQIEFTDPRYLNKLKGCKRNLLSDIYSLGVIFWEISSGKIPFQNYNRRLPGKVRNALLSLKIIRGGREEVPPETPKIYSSLYQRCWESKRSKRPTLEKIIGNLTSLLNIMQTSNIDNNVQDNTQQINGMRYDGPNINELDNYESFNELDNDILRVDDSDDENIDELNRDLDDENIDEFIDELNEDLDVNYL